MNPFARHINLQLSYTFQQAGGAVHNSLHLGPGGGMGVLSGSPFGPNGSFGSHHHNNNNNNNSTNINNNHSSKSSAYSTHGKMIPKQAVLPSEKLS